MSKSSSTNAGKSKDTKETSPSADDLKKAASLVKALIAEGIDPPTVPGSKMWDPLALAKWYGSCRTVSSWLGKDNPWQSMLCSWDSSKGDDRAFHVAMLGTLQAIAQYLGVS
jgi:hypothetical protein